MIKFPNDLTIAQVDAYSLEIQSCIDKNQKLSIDDSQLMRIDTIGVQFILAVVTYISAQGKELVWQSTSKILHQSIQQLGITDAILIQYMPSKNG